MITHLLAADAQPLTIGPGAWLTIASTVVTVAVGVLTLLRAAKTWFSQALRTSDGRSLTAVVEQNSLTLLSLHTDFERLADDVREIRTHQTGLNERMTMLERRVDDFVVRGRRRG